MNHMPIVRPPRRLPKYLLPVVCLLLAVFLLVTGCSGNLHREIELRGVVHSSDGSVPEKDQQEGRK